MKPQFNPSPDRSSPAFSHMIHQLAENKQINGEESALRDAEGFARGCFAFIRAERGSEAEREFIKDMIAESVGLHEWRIVHE